jgi:aminoglycoside phosphotransferase (APT) family kinase protein
VSQRSDYRKAPAASGARLDWALAPERVQSALESWLGSPIVSAQTQLSGFSPGAAARLRTADGRRFFAKAVGPELNLDSPRFHRREARVLAAFPENLPVAKLLWTYDEGDEGWVLLLFEDVEGWHPAEPWQEAELIRILEAIAELSRLFTPVPESLAHLERSESDKLFTQQWWRQVALDPPPLLDDWSRRHLGLLIEHESRAPAAVAGESLVHSDIRADNVLLTEDRVVIVDWAHARIGAGWIDLLCFFPSVAMQGGPDIEQLFIQHPLGSSADPAAVSAVLAAIAGYLTYNEHQPEPPGLPGLRAFQAAQGVEARRWLATRLGLEA